MAVIEGMPIKKHNDKTCQVLIEHEQDLTGFRRSLILHNTHPQVKADKGGNLERGYDDAGNCRDNSQPLDFRDVVFQENDRQGDGHDR